MKQNGVNVASDFLLHLASSGPGGACSSSPVTTRGPSPASTRGSHGSSPSSWRSPSSNQGPFRRPRT
jgi:hypothetical protein